MALFPLYEKTYINLCMLKKKIRLLKTEVQNPLKLNIIGTKIKNRERKGNKKERIIELIVSYKCLQNYNCDLRRCLLAAW